MDKATYSLYGFVNFFKAIPNFVYPIFINDGELYIQIGKTKDMISAFELLDLEYVKLSNSTIRYISEFDEILDDIGNEVYSVGDNIVYAFQLTDRVFLWGELSFILNEIKKHPRKIKRVSFLEDKIKAIYDENFVLPDFEENDMEFPYLLKEPIRMRGMRKRNTAHRNFIKRITTD